MLSGQTKRGTGPLHFRLASGRTYINNLTYNTMYNDIRQARAAIIAELNDAFRETGQGGTVHLTSGVWERGTAFVAEAVRLVQSFKDFTPENDPDGEHDFGSVAVAGQRIFWKIDYYDAAMEWGSEDPANPDKTTRVLTIMLAQEY